MKKITAFLCLLLLTALGCGLFSPGGSSTPADPEVAAAVTQTLLALLTAQAPTSAPPADSPQQPPLSTPTSEPAEQGSTLVAYILDGDVYTWRRGGQTARLTEHGRARELSLSPDGQWIAYLSALSEQQMEIWALRSDGSSDDPLVAAADLTLPPGSESLAAGMGSYWVNPSQLEWLPGSHTLYFTNQLTYEGPGVPPLNDLWIANLDTREKKPLLAPGTAGQHFQFSPDGSRILLLRGDRFLICASDGSGLRELFTYPQVYTYSEWTYLPDPVWVDSGKFRAVIPPQDPLSYPDDPSVVWEIPADGSPARQLYSFTGLPAWQARPLLSPSGGMLLFQAEKNPGGSVSDLHMVSLDPGTEWIVLSGPYQALDWAPDENRFVVRDINRQELRIGALDGSLITWPVGISPREIRWVDSRTFLAVSASDHAELVLGTIDNQYVNLASAGGFTLPFDFIP